MSSTLGRQTISQRRTAPRVRLGVSERPECQPVAPSADIMGPQYDVTNAYNFSHSRAPSMKMSVDNEDELPPAATVTPMQQYPVDPSKGGATGRQFLSKRPNTAAHSFSERPETMPVPVPSSYEGPAQFCHETKFGDRGIAFMEETLSNDAEVQRITRRSFPIVDNGQLKQGCAVTIVHPMQQYPVPLKRYSSIGLQVLANRPATHAIRFSERPEPMALQVGASDVGPASFPQRSSFNTSSMGRLPLNLASEHNTPMPSATKVSKVSDHLMGTHSCTSLAQWGKDAELKSCRDGNAAAALKITLGSKKTPTEAQKRKHTLGTINSLSDWLREFGHPQGEAAAFARPAKGRGHVAPTHVSKASTPSNAAAAARTANLVLQGKTEDVLKQRAVFHRRPYTGEGVMGVPMPKKQRAP